MLICIICVINTYNMISQHKIIILEVSQFGYCRVPTFFLLCIHGSSSL